MSLRRPFRDSWEQREYKRAAKSHSPVPKPSWTPIRRLSSSLVQPESTLPSTVQNTEHNTTYVYPTVEDDYPERLALSPTLESEFRHNEANEEDILVQPEATFGQPGRARQPPFPVFEPLDETVPPPLDFSSTKATVGTVSPKSSDEPAQPSRPASDPSTIYPDESVSNTQSISSASALVTDNFNDSSILTLHPPRPQSASDIERAILESPDFPVHLIRPVPDLITLLTQIAPVIGDPGTGHFHFGDQATSPTNSIFHQWTVASQQKWYAGYDPLKDSVLKEKPVDTFRDDNLQWKRDFKVVDPSLYTLSNSRGSSSKLTTTSTSNRASADSNNTSSGTQSWKGRQYSTNPSLRTRNLSIDLLERKISHGELLSLHLSIDARRDAISIGGTASDIGGSLLNDTGRGASRQGLAIDANGSVDGISRVSTATTARTSSSSRTRDSARNSSMSVASGSSGHTRSERAMRRNEERGYSEYDQGTWRYQAGDISTTFDTGRYGVGGVMLWRLVRVAAAVGDEEHVAWWCVPERSVGGFF